MIHGTKITFLLSYTYTIGHALSIPPPSPRDLTRFDTSALTVQSPRTCSLATNSSRYSLTHREEYRYPIPHTPRTLELCIEDRNINPEAFNTVAEGVLFRVRRHILYYGDSTLELGDVPYQYNVTDCYFEATSNLGPEVTPGHRAPLMTYGMIKEVMKGLQVIMQGRQGPSEVFWDLENADGTRLGIGHIVEEVFPDSALLSSNS